MQNLRKIVLLGDAAAGKTTFIRRLIDKPFNSTYIPTSNRAVYRYRIEDVNYNIWDVPGQEKFGPKIEEFCDSADLAMIFDSFRDEKSFNSINWWIKKYKNASPDKPFMIIGTKEDLGPPKLTIPEHNILSGLTPYTYRISCRYGSVEVDAIVEEAHEILSVPVVGSLKDN